ncbi:MAG TPA: DUF5719 family protein [Candidatus Anoxymicrobiaceae bacterium]
MRLNSKLIAGIAGLVLFAGALLPVPSLAYPASNLARTVQPVTAVGQAVEAEPTSRTWGHDSIGVTAPQRTWYLAEGCTARGFETWVLVQNPNAVAAHITITYMTGTGPRDGPVANLAANSRTTFNVADTAPDSTEVSTKVKANIPVIAERAMYGNDRQWGHDSIGASETAEKWYLAEGCTRGGFETWVLVQNPGNDWAYVTLTYMTVSAAVAGPSVSVPPGSRQTFNVADTVPDSWQVSTVVSSDTPVVAERAMYGNNRSWGDDSIGASEAASSWYLAEGCTKGGFETWVLVQNPENTGVEVHLTFMTPAGPVTGPSAVLDAYTRRTFNVAESVPDAWQVSTRVDANKPIVAERAMYGNNRSWAHDSIGTTAPAADWYLAEGCTARGFETWVLVQNPNADEVKITLTYMTGGGLIPGPTAVLPPNSRMTFNVWETTGTQVEVSTVVHAIGGGVIAERAMYGDPR